MDRFGKHWDEKDYESALSCAMSDLLGYTDEDGNSVFTNSLTK